MKNGTVGHMLFIIMAFAVMTRLWGINESKSFIGDEGMVTAGAVHFFERGNFSPDNWYHPHFNYFIIKGSMAVLGNNPLGWRLTHALLGTASVLLIFLLGKELFSNSRTALLAALFCAQEPLHIFFSRTDSGDIVAVFFLISSIYLTVRFLQGSLASSIWAGVCIGLCLSERWYFFFVLMTLAAFSLALRSQTKNWSALEGMHIISSFTIIPLTLYLLSFYPWFKRGYNLMEFLQMEMDAFHELQSIRVESFVNEFLRSTLVSPWKWFSVPILNGVMVSQEGKWGRFMIVMNNFPIWLLTFPAVVYLGYLSWKKRDHWYAFVVLLFLATYAQFALVKRPLFLYSALIVLPFAYLGVANLIVGLIAKSRHEDLIFGCIAGTLLLWGIYVYPFASGLLVPIGIYSQLLPLGNFH